MKKVAHQSIEQVFSVPYNYQVFFTKALFSIDNNLFADLVSGEKIPKVYFVLDEGVVLTNPNLIDSIHQYSEKNSDVYTLCAAPLVIPGGELVKNDQNYFQKVLKATDEYGIDRHSYIVGLGGGALLDMVGFAATIAHRGIRHIRIPTTVLSQNDSGVGVKNGINAFGKKNYLGAFCPPYAVINDSDFLQTLEQRDWRSGISEALKVALIKDASFFLWIEEKVEELLDRGSPAMQELIYRCAQMHLDHIASGDPFETGSSRPLDFGHWAAHKLEHLTDYKVRHGEAVAIGIALDTTYSYLAGKLSENELNRVLNVIAHLGFDLYQPELSGEVLLKGLEEFREHLGGELTIMLLDKIGHGVEVHEMDNDLIINAIGKLKALQLESPKA
ncbi:MAG: 3-dehydroquinate synthase [Cytophagales bacterium]|mgnify:CR=1 FL=1|uniref:3-dehydroquinate synthase n=1 Tax=Cyclobacterium marinum TaxID=104 RepID=UPI0011EFAD2D|nr:3-dehydroquinate synthase [Cyclobacterium marinum]MBI0401401.1 3-dehydroquinate synthase [Cyclobacterium marinum]MBR9774471.1 3-dehydroquinate synthase [Cytophagales bacterium]|tara:strand:- start:123010 stop:124170 length:1161 start_codon:yes stop_codon:yes gene_type:complete